MKNFDKFLNKIKTIHIEVEEYRFLNGANWLKTKDYPNLPKNLKNSYLWELKPLNKNELKKLQSKVLSEITRLNENQINNCLKRLELINDFKEFNKFIKSFYVKVDNNTHNGLDVSDFKTLLEQCFYVEVPNKGIISIEFLTELTDQVFFKSGLIEQLKHQIGVIAENNQPQQNETNKPEVYKTQNLFKVGLLFAKGDMNKYFTVNNKHEIVMKSEYSAPKISTEIKENLNISVNDKFILASMNNYTNIENKNKNIFNSLDMMTKIISHCETENIPIDTYFKSRLPTE